MANSISFQIEGLENLLVKFGAAGQETMIHAAAAELFEVAEEIMSESKDQYVPVRTGNLMGTGHVDLPEIDEGSVTVNMGYGGPAAPYAIYVHEALEGTVPPSPDWSWTKHVERGEEIHWTRPGSGPKYLERPFRAASDGIPDRVGTAIREALMNL
jgi:hypothetical protein